MADPVGIKDLSKFILESKDATESAKLRALIATVQFAEAQAKKNAKEQFKGRNDRTLTGRLLNSIYSGYEKQEGPNGEITGYVGTKGIPYGRIHEYGGTIVPIKAKHLWIPQYAKAGKMTPKEFIRLTQSNPKFYHLFNKFAGRWTGAYRYSNDRGSKIKKKVYEPLFFLVDKVTIPERPYITPAMEVALEKFDTFFSQFLGEKS